MNLNYNLKLKENNDWNFKNLYANLGAKIKKALLATKEECKQKLKKKVQMKATKKNFMNILNCLQNLLTD